jgi:type IV pilus assembly protein PilN
MIKINLLAEGKRPVVARKAKPKLLSGPKDVANTLLAVGVVVGLLAAATWFLIVRNQLERKKQDVAAAQREVDELQQVIKEVEDFKHKKAELERKIEVINGLKANQRGPVRIMDEISKALPELLWLTSLDVTATRINLRGSAFNMSAIASFMDNLDRVEQFQEPILTDSTQRSARSAGKQIYDFKLNFGYSFLPPKPQTPAADAADAGAQKPAAGSGAVATAAAAKAARERGVE